MNYTRFTSSVIIVSFVLGGLACTITGSLMAMGTSHHEADRMGQSILAPTEEMTCCAGIISSAASFVPHLGQGVSAIVVPLVLRVSKRPMVPWQAFESLALVVLAAAIMSTARAKFTRLRYGGDRVFVYFDNLFSQGILNPKLF